MHVHILSGSSGNPYLVRWCWQRVRWQERWVQSLIATAGTEWSLQASPQGRERARSCGWGGGGMREERRGTVPGCWPLPAPLGYCCCCWRSRRRWRLSPDQPPSQWGGHQSSRTDPGTEERTYSEYFWSSPKHLVRSDMQQEAHLNVSSNKDNNFLVHIMSWYYYTYILHTYLKYGCLAEIPDHTIYKSLLKT